MKCFATLAVFGCVFFLSTALSHADIVVAWDRDARLITTPTGDRDDNNGGDTASGALIGENAGDVNNFMLYGFDVSAASGNTVLGAVVTIAIANGQPGNQGSSDDTIFLHELAIGNSGWAAGGGQISAADNPATDGSVTYLHRAGFDNVATNVDWVDSVGSAVSNVEGAFNTLGSQAGFDTPPLSITFAIDAATAQQWADSGLAGLALSAVESTTDGDDNARFNFLSNDNAVNAASSLTNITFLTAVPEPSSAFLLGSIVMVGLLKRRRG